MIYPPSPENIRKAARILKKGGIIAFPTETVYGLGGDAFNKKALKKIFKAKQRPFNDPLIMHISGMDMLDKLADFIPETAFRMMKIFWPGPLTLVLHKKNTVPDLATAGLQTVAVRMPAHRTALKLIKTFGGPIAAPSANPFGYISPVTARHVERMLGKKTDMVINGGPCEHGIESTIIDFTSSIPVLLRPGSIPLEDIRKVSGRIKIRTKKDNKGPLAPGRLPWHYSPHKKLVLLPSTVFRLRMLLAHWKNDRSKGFIAFKGLVPGNLNAVILSQKGELAEAGSRLFHVLHEFDRSDVTTIYAERMPSTGTGRAIMDRLRKAASRPAEKLK